jgi:hypothetical protein
LFRQQFRAFGLHEIRRRRWRKRLPTSPFHAWHALLLSLQPQKGNGLPRLNACKKQETTFRKMETQQVHQTRNKRQTKPISIKISSVKQAEVRSSFFQISNSRSIYISRHQHTPSNATNKRTNEEIQRTRHENAKSWLPHTREVSIHRIRRTYEREM